jgi:hypothetical protein
MIVLVATLHGLSFLLGCGNASHSQISTPGFSNASLNGNYVFTLNGASFSSNGSTDAYQEAGTFVADGGGHITSGVDTFAQNSGLSTGQLTGSYSVSHDGTGTISLNSPRGAIVLAVTVVSASNVYLIEFDTAGSGAGIALRADATAFSEVPSGPFIFHFHSRANGNGSGSVSSVGSMSIAGNSINGNQDIVRAGVPGSNRVTGTLTAPDTDGKGTLALTDDSGNQSNYLYLVIDSSTLIFLQTDAGILGGGRAEAQSAGPFNNASLTNGFAFSCSGDTQVNILGVNSAGAFTADGNGNIVSGSYDSAQDRSLISNDSLTGTYTVSSNGRALITLNLQGQTPLPLVAWMVNSSRAFFLVSTPDIAEDGRLEQQQSNSFSAASLNGQYSFYLYGYDTHTPPAVNREGVMVFDGSSTLTFTDYFVSRGSSTMQKGPLVGNYAVSANGRVTATAIGAVNTQIIYLISNSSGYLLLGAGGSELAGSMAQQTP